MSMTIKELLQSTSTVEYIRESKSGKKVTYRPFDPKATFTKKRFGTIYAYNKVIKAKPKHSIIEITMMLEGLTDKVSSKRAGAKPVAAHRVMVAIKGVESEILSADELVERMKLANPIYADEERYVKEDILLAAIDPDNHPFKDKTVMEQKDGTFAIIDNKIPDDAEIRCMCSCSSYYWCFQWYNIQNDVCINLRGGGSSMYNYKHKTEKGKEMFSAGTPMRNPQQAPGVCKHIMLLLAMLTDKGTIASQGGKGGTRSIKSYYRANMNRFKKESRLSTSEYKKLMSDFKKDKAQKNKQREVNSGGGKLNFADIASSMRSGEIND